MERGRSITQERVHIVGIGGIGFSAIARVLLAWGTQVSGSDLRLSQITDDLAALGARVVEGHAAENLGDATLVLVSSAIPADNPEVRAARERGIPVLKRADFLGEMMAGKVGIAVAGTHGKTTTTALTAHVLTEQGLDPTAIVGGIVGNWDSNARTGQGRYFVIEADEYDGMFLGLRPEIAVVTHLEMDHPDCYPTLKDMIAAFHSFLQLVPGGGSIVACMDEPNVKELIAGFAKRERPETVAYGLSPEAMWSAVEIQPNESGGSDFWVTRKGVKQVHVRLPLPGQHNVKNALAVMAISDLLGLELDAVAETLASFDGVKRRFEVKGQAGGVTVVDDYAHHPTKIQATLCAARERYGEREIWAVFQPHTYSRTKVLFDEFADAFGDADHVVITDIYAAREHDTLGMHSRSLVEAMRGRARDAHYCPTLDDAVDYLAGKLRPGDVLITLGAGDGFRIGERILEILETE